MNDAIMRALIRAVDAAPEDRELRTYLAEVLLTAGRAAQAIPHCARLLVDDPADQVAAALMARALGTPPAPAAGDGPAAGADGFDWEAAEAQVQDLAEPMFLDADAGPDPSQNAWDVERSDLTLADVAGMREVKDRLEAAFLAPMRNPELRAMYGKSLRGGLLMYGPPGCGKTFIARALAGEMGARFISVGLADVLDQFIGNSEKNIHALFQLARREAPVVLFLDEIDALGQKRSATRHSGLRGAVNQLLQELDGVDAVNEGVFVLAATNQVWDVDPALRRPGRLDRTLLVTPPDQVAREAVLRHHLRTRPVAGVDLPRLARDTDGFSGADLAHLCESAAELALLDSVRRGEPRMITMADLQAALGQVRPSCGPWFDVARNVAMYGDDATYADLRTYLKKTRRL